MAHSLTPSSSGDVRVGTSGWRYASWRGDFYPRGLAQRRELEYIGSRFSTVELNGSFYSLQRPSSYQRWRDSVPGGFVFAVKGSRYVTHMLRMRGAETALANFFASGVLALGEALGPVLWQLPERQEFETEIIDEFLGMLPRSTGAALELARRHDERLEGRAWLEIDEDRPIRYALEPRAESFREAGDLLRHHGVAMVTADTAGRFPRFDETTADFAYIRLHGAQELYHSGYTAEELDGWARLIDELTGSAESSHGVYVYFDNDARGHAPHDALALAARTEHAR
ncbi:DUF72 domain-containing protein [Microbacterium abyssi]|uniref:DUF72 domain-containing protein n=1 Tax=Microbacterium abyssi TaxID=2782166 RepID=UPI001886EE4D|nr:DUF72 domain-containing protein [Microbacterium sp. A18JL241]